MFKIFKNLNVCVCVSFCLCSACVCACVCLYAVCVQVPTEARRGHHIAESGVPGGRRPPSLGAGIPALIFWKRAASALNL